MAIRPRRSSASRWPDSMTMRLILLGSGAVRPDLEHWGPAQVVQVGGENLLFDCGRGASMRLVQAGVPLWSIRRVFFTHHHFDHTCDFAYLFLASWTLGRDVPMEVIGPRGTEQFCSALFSYAYKDDIATRRGHPIFSAKGERWTARDVAEDEFCVQGHGYVVRMIHVEHKSPILDNLAFRVESEGKAIVIVGDTTLCADLMEFADGADLLVHECSFPSHILERERWGSFHTDPRELGRWARRRGVKRLLLKHFCLRPGVVDLDTLVSEVRETFGNEGLIVGTDLLTVEL